ncbi:MAG: DNA recombination protein RmuC [Dysgonamonadaceae bacterium]|jgi:DNA recombination protein RmuC|nr:DNA recombination protein RmuC [Dysgonamonadaceae bacterium]
MTTIFLIVIIFLTIVNIVLIINKKTAKEPEELKTKLIQLDAGISKIDPLVRDEFGRNREESQKSFKENREELNNSFKRLGDTFTQNIKDFNELQRQKFDDLSNRQEQVKKSTEDKLKEIRETIERKLQNLQEENSKKLEDMRKVVDEKLQETVEKRFNESFKLISERLEQVHKGLGEMQSLASGVGDLKKVLTNVKTRGNLGEIQLGAILEQILSPEQYEQNAVVKEGSQERVEYVIKLPGKSSDNKFLLLPVDSKFPNEDYQRLLDAYDNLANLNPKEMETVVKQFENSVKKNAKDIRDKYINPPVTTDFAIMFVPTEGLYAEILRRTGLFEILQRDFKITVVGPTNLVAFLSSLQMGFKTLAIEKRSSEVWEILGAVKNQFSTFGDVLEKTKKKLQQATNVIDLAGVRSRAIERKLRTVQELPQEQSIELLGEAIEIEQDNIEEIEDDEE